MKRRNELSPGWYLFALAIGIAAAIFFSPIESAAQRLTGPLTIDVPDDNPAMAVVPSQPLSVEIAITEVSTATQDVSKVVVTYGDVTLDVSERVIRESTTKENAALIIVSEKAVVTAFNQAFEVFLAREVDTNVYLLVATPGKYLVIVDVEGGRSTIRTVELKPHDSGPAPPPIDPPIEPVPDLSDLAKLSADLAAKINDPTTQAQLAASLGALDLLASSSIETAQAKVQTVVEGVLLARQGDSKFANWLDGWRRPLQSEMQKTPLTLESYAEAIKHIAAGLKKKISDVKRSNPVTKAKAAPPAISWKEPDFLTTNDVGMIWHGRRLERRCQPNGTCQFIWIKIDP